MPETATVSAFTTPTRTELIMAAVRRELLQRAEIINKAADLGQLEIAIRLDPGSNVIRTIQVTDQRIYRRR